MLSTFLFLLRIKKFDLEICEDLLFFWSGPQFDFGGTANTVKHGEGKLWKKETKNISKLLLFPSYHKYPKILQTSKIKQLGLKSVLDYCLINGLNNYMT